MMHSSSKRHRHCVYVLSDMDGCKYKLIVQGEIRQLGTRKIMRYLEAASGIEAAHQRLSFNGKTLTQEQTGEDIGLFDGAVLRLQLAQRSGTPVSLESPPQQSSVSAPGRSTERQIHFSPTSPSRVVDPPQPQGDHGSSRRRSASRARGQPLFPDGPASSAARHPANNEGTFISRIGSEDSPTLLPPGSVMSSHRLQTESPHYPSSYTDGRPSSDPAAMTVRSVMEENAQLRRRLVNAERHAANATSDWKLQEKIEELRRSLAGAEADKQSAAAAAEARWLIKEEELVKELDLLREERRRLRAEHELFAEGQRDLVAELEGQLRAQQAQLQERDHLVQQLRYNLAGLQSRLNPEEDSPLRHREEPLPALDEALSSALDEISEGLSLPRLHLNAEHTCAIEIGGQRNVLVTLDYVTEYLFFYVTLLTYIPESSSVRLGLYERLLEGALLGKDMGGGGVGISKENELVLMSTSVDIRRSRAGVVAAVARSFVDAARTWTQIVDDELQRL